MIADTLQRLIFYKAAIMSNKKAVLLFEEPEAHCFEPYILEFTNDVKYDENDNQFFIVTHSDFIIKEFLRDEESKENTNIYLVNNVDGETQVKLLEKDKNEDVYEYGMNVFFNFESLWETN
jgi:AAA15 family ATPase/GTPase